MVGSETRELLVIYAINENDEPQYGYNAFMHDGKVSIYCDEYLHNIFPYNTSLKTIDKNIEEVFSDIYDFNEYIHSRIYYKKNEELPGVYLNVGRTVIYSEPDSEQPYYGRVESIEDDGVVLFCDKELQSRHPQNPVDVHVRKTVDDLYNCMSDFQDAMIIRDRSVVED